MNVLRNHEFQFLDIFNNRHLKRLSLLKTGVPIPFAGLTPEYGVRDGVDMAFILTNHCKGACQHCYNVSGPKGGMELDPSLVTSLISKAADEDLFYPDCSTRRIGFSGGEALLYPEIEKVVDFAVKTGVLVACMTGGIGIETSKIKNLADVGCHKLTLSYDHFHARFLPKEQFVNLVNIASRCFTEVSIQVSYSDLKRGFEFVQTFIDEIDETVSIALLPVEPVGRARSLNDRRQPDVEYENDKLRDEFSNLKGEDASELFPSNRVVSINFDGGVYFNCSFDGFSHENYIGHVKEFL